MTSTIAADSLDMVIDTKDIGSPDLMEDITQIETECELLSPQSRVHPAYSRLDKDCLRLLKIMQGKEGSDVYCYIEQFPIDSAPKFTALSYTWGSQHGTHNIFINGSWLRVPKNLWRFLTEARKLPEEFSGWLWNDMLSINQRDIEEKSLQINMIHKIFATAERIVIWLGPAYRGSDLALKAMTRPATCWLDSRRRRQLWASTAGPCIKELCFRPYWRRLWVFQELKVAQERRIMCGSIMVPWHGFEELMLRSSAWYTRHETPRLLDEIVPVESSPAMHMVWLKNDNLKPMLWDLVEKTSNLRCADVRDRAFALLGVAETGCEGFEPDYGEPVSTLLNKLLHKVHELAPPTSFGEVIRQCEDVEATLHVPPGSIFMLQGQRGAYEAPSDADQRAVGFGGERISLWWATFYEHACVQDMLLKDFSIRDFLSREDEVPRRVYTDVSAAASVLKRCQDDFDRNLGYSPATSEHRNWSVFDSVWSMDHDEDRQLYHLKHREPMSARMDRLLWSAAKGQYLGVMHLLLEVCARCMITLPRLCSPGFDLNPDHTAAFSSRYCSIEYLQILLRYGIYPVQRAKDGMPEMLRRGMHGSIGSSRISDSIAFTASLQTGVVPEVVIWNDASVFLDLALSKATREQNDGVLDALSSGWESGQGPQRLDGLQALVIAIMIKFETFPVTPKKWLPLTFATRHGHVETAYARRARSSIDDSWHETGSMDTYEQRLEDLPFGIRKANLGFAFKRVVDLLVGTQVVRISSRTTSTFPLQSFVEMSQESHTLLYRPHGDEDLYTVPIRPAKRFRIDILPVSMYKKLENGRGGYYDR